MAPVVNDPPQPTQPADSSPTNFESEAADPVQHEPRNILALAVYQIVLRVGWIFKTESIVMPAFLDMAGGSAALRGWLPLLNRFGHSIPPLLLARRLKVMPFKKRALTISSAIMGATFLALAGICHWMPNSNALPVLFLIAYAVFFAAVGFNQLSLNTVQGKLIRPHRRGRLLLISTVVGSAVAISFAWWLLGDWLKLPNGGFGYIFGFTGVCFLIAALASIWLTEAPDRYDEPRRGLAHPFLDAARILREDVNFRRLAATAMLFSGVLMLFPHYQALARERLSLEMEEMVVWVIVQNAGAGLFSLVVGPLADRKGNRLVLRLQMMTAALTPLLAIGLANAGQSWGQALFPLVFVMIGLTPITLKTMMNYTLEISAPPDHPRYVSTLSLCLAVPFVASPAVGELIDVTSFESVFFGGSALIAMGGLMTLTLIEPRHHVARPAAADITEE